MAIVNTLLSGFKDASLKRIDSKRRFAARIRDLYSALQECHKSYINYIGNQKYHELKALELHPPNELGSKNLYVKERALFSNLEPLREEWLRSVEKLAKIVWKERHALQIFDPQVYELLQSYTLDEATHCMVNFTDDAEVKKWKIRNLANYINRQCVEASAKPAKFEEATNALGQFIRNNSQISDFF
jgi:hypothetical protein